jgi:hypothetical protein
MFSAGLQIDRTTGIFGIIWHNESIRHDLAFACTISVNVKSVPLDMD